MPSNFDFLAGEFPKLAEYGHKAETYLYLDSDVCMFFVSRIFDNVLKYLCSVNNVDNDGTKLAEPINELFQKKAIDEGVYSLLEMMRTFRNGNAHDKDYSQNESMILLQVSHVLCEWLMETYGNSGYTRKGFIMPPNSAKSVTHQPPVPLKLGDIVECTVNNVIAYGVFAQVDGMKGLLHRNEIPSGSVEGYKVGDKFTAKIIGIDSVQGHVALSVSQLQQVQPPAPAKTTQSAQPAAPAQSQLPAMSDSEFINLCATGAAQKVKAAITNGANVNAKKAKGRTALIAAVLTNPHPDVIELLIDSGANVNAKTNKGLNALEYAHHNEHLANTRALARLKALTEPKLMTETEKFLQLCISGTGTEIAAAIKNGANVNAAYSDGITALMTAARSNNADAVNVLLVAGANVSAKDKAGHTAAYWASTNPKLKSSNVIKHL